MTEKSKILYEGKYIRLMSRDTWEYAERMNCSGVVFIMAVTEDNRAILCEQYRAPVQKSVIEVPAGLVNDVPGEKEESLEEAAKRELLEETGYQAERMVLMLEGPAAAGSSSVLIHFYRAEGLKKIASGGGDETENITVHEVPLKDFDFWLRRMQSQGKLIDPRVLSVPHLVHSKVFGGR